MDIREDIFQDVDVQGYPIVNSEYNGLQETLVELLIGRKLSKDGA
jgi:hypothetical protein